MQAINWRNAINITLKLLLFLLLAGLVYAQLFYEKDAVAVLNDARSHLHPQHKFILFLCLFLMPLNWWLEARKFQKLIQQDEKITGKNAIKAILAGVTVSTLTPNRTADFAGRIWFVAAPVRAQVVVASFIGSYAQLFVTISVGFIALYLLPKQLVWQNFLNIPTWLFITLALVTLLLLITYLPKLIRKFQVIFTKEKWRIFISKIHGYFAYELLQVLGLSLLRYCVYSFQYGLALVAFGIDIDIMTSIGVIGSIFLMQTIIPTITAAEPGIKSNIALQVVGLYSANAAGIVAATLVIWIFNLILPAMAGLYFLSKIEFYKTQIR